MKALVISVVLLAGVVACQRRPQEVATPVSSSGADATAVVSGGFSPQELQAFTALAPIDTHTHVLRTDPAFNAMLDRLNIHLLDIILVDDRNPEVNNLQAERTEALKFIRSSSGRAILCTSFDPFNMRKPGFAAAAIRGLNDDFAHGAIAVKLWKNVGMEIKNSSGNYVLPDDPALAPIYRDIAAHNKTLVAHVADPDSAWAPPNPASPDYSYYSENPKWYMYGKPHPASKDQILRARDHILEQNPNLRLVGAHLGSMEADLHELAQHLDRYPNFAVDMAARMPYFVLHPRADMIAFILKYQDRLIYGTDLEFSAKDRVRARMDFWEQTYARDWRFLATNETVDYDGHVGQGLALPDSVLRKIYHNNAVRWFPGILHESH
jgi:predicted TIM-barrel fold metal-dependent hydrolase